jgi:pimeloyl-ACP methyl ester carboxylesterase
MKGIILHPSDDVDKNNIGLEGHSMGGWASLVAAAAYPKDYRAFVLASSSPGTYGTPEGTPAYPRNMALIYSTFDEFSQHPVSPVSLSSAARRRIIGCDIPVGAALYGIVMFQFLPIFTIVALLSTYFLRKTGHVYVGAFANALVITWIVVANQATHFPY